MFGFVNCTFTMLRKVHLQMVISDTGSALCIYLDQVFLHIYDFKHEI